MALVSNVILSGLDSAKPAASASNNGYLYLSTDVSGGTLYRSNGTTWVACGAGVSAAGSVTFSGCALYASANFSISASGLTTITWDSESLDTDGYHSTVSNTGRITIPTGKGGTFMVVFNLPFQAAVSETVAVRLYKNGVDTGIQYGGTMNANGAINVSGTEIKALADGDYLELKAIMANSTRLLVGGAAGCCQFGVQKIG